MVSRGTLGVSHIGFFAMLSSWANTDTSLSSSSLLLLLMSPAPSSRALGTGAGAGCCSGWAPLLGVLVYSALACAGAEWTATESHSDAGTVASDGVVVVEGEAEDPLLAAGVEEEANVEGEVEEDEDEDAATEEDEVVVLDEMPTGPSGNSSACGGGMIGDGSEGTDAVGR